MTVPLGEHPDLPPRPPFHPRCARCAGLEAENQWLRKQLDATLFETRHLHTQLDAARNDAAAATMRAHANEVTP